MRFMLTSLALAALSSISGSADADETKFFWSGCIAYGEFQDGAFSQESTVTASERYAARENNDTFQYVLDTVRNKSEIDAGNIAVFHTKIDEDGISYENHYISHATRLGYHSRQDVIVSGLCMY